MTLSELMRDLNVAVETAIKHKGTISLPGTSLSEFMRHLHVAVETTIKHKRTISLPDTSLSEFMRDVNVAVETAIKHNGTISLPEPGMSLSEFMRDFRVAVETAIKDKGTISLPVRVRVSMSLSEFMRDLRVAVETAIKHKGTISLPGMSLSEFMQNLHVAVETSIKHTGTISLPGTSYSEFMRDLHIAVETAIKHTGTISLPGMSLSEFMRDLNVAVETAIKHNGNLKDKKLFDDLCEIIKTAKKGVTDAVGDALCRMYATKPSIDAVQDLLEGIPDALFFTAKDGRLPIQIAVFDSVKYLPILAKFGIKHNVGGRGMRGGLLLADPTTPQHEHWNALKYLVCLGDKKGGPILNDTISLNAIKELRKDKILLKQDIKDHDLIYWSCTPNANLRFEYLAEWDPDALMTSAYGMPLIHAINLRIDISRFKMFFQTSLKYHPRNLGLIFQKDSSGKTAYDTAVGLRGKNEVLKVIQECIPTNTSLPILHHVVKDAPQHINDFCIRYSSAGYLRDENGRTFTQTAIASASKTLSNDGVFFVKMTDDEIAEVDPVTKLYPFLVAANGETSDLSTIYFLLSKNPSLLERYREQVTGQLVEEVGTKKRKRVNEND